MNYEKLKLLYALSCVALSLIVLLPSLTAIVGFPEREKFSELWILGQNHMAGNYPFNVSAGALYTVYLGVANHMGDLGYFKVYVKLRNQSEPLPDRVDGLPSPLEPIFEYEMFLRSNETWERAFSFSFASVSFEGNVSRISKVLVDGYTVDVEKTAVWNKTNSSFYYQLFFELWAYNATVSSFKFQHRFVGFGLNLTKTL
jgi:hypothetical protein